MARWLSVLAVIVTILGVATLRVIVSGEEELDKSTAALDAGDAREAIVRARRSARWYAPGAPHVDVAYDRLIALAGAAEENRHDDLALLAWRGVRVAVIETRWIVSTRPQHLKRANEEIARITAKVPKVAAPDPRMRAEALQLLMRHEPPRLQWVGLLVTGFVLLATGLFVWARQVSAAGGRLQWNQAKLGTVLSIIGALCWLIAVWRA